MTTTTPNRALFNAASGILQVAPEHSVHIRRAAMKAADQLRKAALNLRGLLPEQAAVYEHQQMALTDIATGESPGVEEGMFHIPPAMVPTLLGGLRLYGNTITRLGNQEDEGIPEHGMEAMRVVRDAVAALSPAPQALNG